jgi:hypothetical protein
VFLERAIGQGDVGAERSADDVGAGSPAPTRTPVELIEERCGKANGNLTFHSWQIYPNWDATASHKTGSG